MTPKPSQTDRLLAMLRAGSVTTTELRHAGLGNPSERVRELEARGFVIRHRDETHPNGHRQTRYDLADVVEEPPMYTHEHGLPVAPALDTLTILPPRATEEERVRDAQLIANRAQREWRAAQEERWAA